MLRGMDASEGQQLFPAVLKLFQHVTPDVAILAPNSRRPKEATPWAVIKQNLK